MIFKEFPKEVKNLKVKAGNLMEFDYLGERYEIMVNEFSRHNHKKYPIYYLEYPLHDDVIEKNGLVVSLVSNNKNQKTNPYSANVEDYWAVFIDRLSLVFRYDLKTNSINLSVFQSEDWGISGLSIKAESLEQLKKIYHQQLEQF